jgi:hemerythrin-like metal-binding protein
MSKQTTSDWPALGFDSMDWTHSELMQSCRQLPLADNLEFARHFPAFVSLVEQDFRGEETLMEAMILPSFQAHIEQHARVLSALHHTASAVMQGDVDTGREAVSLFLNWFSFHIATMDKALVNTLNKKNKCVTASPH